MFAMVCSSRSFIFVFSLHAFSLQRAAREFVITGQLRSRVKGISQETGSRRHDIRINHVLQESAF
jgi:hypothetical protein